MKALVLASIFAAQLCARVSPEPTITDNIATAFERLGVDLDAYTVLGEEPDGHALWITPAVCGVDPLEDFVHTDFFAKDSGRWSRWTHKTRYNWRSRSKPSMNPHKYYENGTTECGVIWAVDFDRWRPSWRRVWSRGGHTLEVVAHFFGGKTNQRKIARGIARWPKRLNKIATLAASVP